MTEHSEENAPQPEHEKTLIIINDSRASEIMLRETFDLYFQLYRPEHLITDARTLPGLHAAQAAYTHDIDYTIMALPGGKLPAQKGEHKIPAPSGRPLMLGDAEFFIQEATATKDFEFEDISERVATYLFIPSMFGATDHIIDARQVQTPMDFSETTLAGTIMNMLEQRLIAQLEAGQEANFQVNIIDPPELGLVQQISGAYNRRISTMHMGYDEAEEEDSASASEVIEPTDIEA